MFGIDPDPAIAKDMGIESFALDTINNIDNWSKNISNGNGFDGVLITAATKSSEPVNTAAML